MTQVAVARKGESSIVQMGKDFGVSPVALHGWLKIADVQDGVVLGVTKEESAELREAKKRIGLLEQEDSGAKLCGWSPLREFPGWSMRGARIMQTMHQMTRSA